MTHKATTSRHRRTFATESEVIVPTDPSSPFTGGGVSTTYITTVRTATGDDLPQYKSVIRQQGNATNDFSGLKTTYQAQGGSSSRVSINYGTDDAGVLFPLQISKLRSDGHFMTPLMGLSPPGSTGVAEDQARARFVTRARRATTQFQSGVFLGEIRETIRAIKHPAESIRRGLDSYLTSVKKQRRGLKNARPDTVRRALGGTWLEYAFGWAPLLSDVKSAAEALAAYNGAFTPPQRVHATGKNESVIANIEDGVSTDYGFYSFRMEVKESVNAYIYGALSSTVHVTAPTFRGSFGLRTRDFLPTIWELIPFSFVTDYFTNVGDIISAVAYDASDLGWSAMSVKSKTVAKSVDVTLYPNSVPISSEYYKVSGNASPGSVETSAESIVRYRAPDLRPRLRFSVPGFRQSFNLAALFASAKSTAREYQSQARRF